MVAAVQPLVAARAEAADSGTVLAWGSDYAGQLGDGKPDTTARVPVAVSGLDATDGVVAVSAGGNFGLALRADGSVLSWGSDRDGELGDGGTIPPCCPDVVPQQTTPVPVSGLGSSGVVAVSAGERHALALRADGSVVAWGTNGEGELGTGDTASQPAPVQVTGLGAGSGVIAVSAGGQLSLALRADGSVLAWGSGGFARMGVGVQNTSAQLAPVAVKGLGPGSGVVAVSAGGGGFGSFSLALRSDGAVMSSTCLNCANNGIQLSEPAVVDGLGVGSGVVAVDAGLGFGLALRYDGSVVSWGAQGSYLGHYEYGPGYVSAPAAVAGLWAGSGVVAISAGSDHSLALLSDGSVLAWGENGSGQLGIGDQTQAYYSSIYRVSPPATSGVVSISAGTRFSLAATTAAPVSGSTFAPLSPARVWDSRPGADPGPKGQIGAGQTRDVTVTGVGGVPTDGVTAVVLNVTAVNASAATFVTAWPTGETRPLASNLNVPVGDTRPNLVVVKVGAGGKVSIYNAAGTVDLLADIAGWYGPTGGQRYTPVSPSRVWDSRGGPGPTGRIGAGQSRDVNVSGLGVTAVALNVTAVNPSAGTYVTAWPTGETKPLASNLNVPAGDTRPNLVIVKVGTGGKVSFYNNSGDVDLIVDVAGYYGNLGSTFNGVSPARAWDSRPGPAPGPKGQVGAGVTRDITVTGVGGVPANGVTAVVLNVTAVSPSSGTFVTAWPAGDTKPLASNLNVPPGDTRPILVIVKVGAGGKVSFYNDAGDVDLIADIAGWYGSGGISPAPAPRAAAPSASQA